MIKSKKEVIIHGRTEESKIIHLIDIEETKDITKGIVSYLISACLAKVENGEVVYVEIERIPAVYKIQTWLKLFGEMTINEFNEKKDLLMIAQVSYNKDKFWGVDSDGWEIVK